MVECLRIFINEELLYGFGYQKDSIKPPMYFDSNVNRDKMKEGKVAKTVVRSPVHKLLDNFSPTLGFFGNFQLVEQLSMHRPTSKFLCLYSHRHVPATSETIKKCRIQEYGQCREYICPIL